MYIELKPPHISHAASLAYHGNQSEVAHYMPHAFPQPYTMQDALRYVGSTNTGILKRTILADGVAVGCIGVTFGEGACHASAEIGYWVGPEFWGNGIATDAIISMTNYIFACYMHINSLYARIRPGNTASRTAIEKAGYLPSPAPHSDNTHTPDGCMIYNRKRQKSGAGEAAPA